MAEQSSADYRGTLGRYALFGEIASGGMATVHLGRLINTVGFARTVAIKRLHPHLAKDPDFVGMFLEEARLAARVRHPNVVATLDVVSEDNELFLVMEYVAGESLSRLIRTVRDAGERIPPRFAVAIMCGALEGLQAAHDATSERGGPLGIVHRDVSPQNIHVGVDGVPRVLDFGIAKATHRVQETRSDQIKGKIQYMSPEQLAKGPIDRRADVYSAAVVLWEALTGKRLFKAEDVPSLVYSIINDEVDPPSSLVPELSPELDAIVMKGLDRDAAKRWASAREMAVALEALYPPAPAREISDWLKAVASDDLAIRIEIVSRIESETSSSLPPPLPKRPTSDLPSGVVDSPSAKDRPREPPSSPKRIYADDARDASMQLEVTAGTETRYRENRSRLWLALVAVLFLLAGATALALRLMQLQSDSPPAAAPSASEEPAAIGLGGARTTPSAEVSAKPSASASAAPAPARPPTASDCDNPFTVDAKGRSHPKPHCFKR